MKVTIAKYILTSFLVFLNMLVYGQTFNVTIDTFDIPINDFIKPIAKIELTHAVKFQNKYCCFFKEVKEDNTRQDLKFCFIISNNGKSLQKVELPDEIQTTIYYDLFLRNDSVFTKNYMDYKTNFLNLEKSKWIRTTDADDMIFEDDHFYFTYLDFGEWGSTTWCKDKHTGKEYKLFSEGTIVNKINSVYYITDRLKILKIENPLKLKPCEKDYYYEIVRQKEFAEGTYSLLGAEVIFKDTTYKYWKQKRPNLTIATSFVADNNLFHLCTDSLKTFIAKLENGRMIPVQVIGKKLSTFDWYYSDRSKIQKDNSQLLKFKTENWFGLIEVKGKEINIHYLHLK